MILADTSIWVEHFRTQMPGFAERLGRGEISTHPVVIGELAMGNLAAREQTLAALQALPRATVATHQECLAFVKEHSVLGRGIGWSDLQLLVASQLSGHALWTIDRRLSEVAAELGMAFRAP